MRIPFGICLVLSFTLTLAADEKPQPRIDYPIFGICEHFDRTPPGKDQALRDVKALDEMACAIYRIDCPWRDIEPKQGGPYNFELIDGYVSLIREHSHSRILMQIGYQPGWAGDFDDPSDQEKMTAYRNAVRAIVQRYAKDVDYWEPWNEPRWFWFRDNEKNWREKAPAMLMAVQKVVYETVRELDPTALVLTAGYIPDAYRKGTDSFWVMDRLFKMGYGRYFDAVCVHNYLGYEPPKALPEKIPDWIRYLRGADMTDLLNLMDRHKLRQPIWLSEFGGYYSTDQKAQALAILCQMAVMMPQRVQAALYYELFDYPHDNHRPLNLIRAKDGHKTLGYFAFRDMTRVLTRAVADPKGLMRVQSQPTLHHRSFRRNNENILFVWSTNNKPVEVDVSCKSEIDEIEIISWNPARDPMRRSELKTHASIPSKITIAPLEFMILIARETK